MFSMNAVSKKNIENLAFVLNKRHKYPAYKNQVTIELETFKAAIADGKERYRNHHLTDFGKAFMIRSCGDVSVLGVGVHLTPCNRARSDASYI